MNLNILPVAINLQDQNVKLVWTEQDYALKGEKTSIICSVHDHIYFLHLKG